MVRSKQRLKNFIDANRRALVGGVIGLACTRAMALGAEERGGKEALTDHGANKGPVTVSSYEELRRYSGAADLIEVEASGIAGQFSRDERDTRGGDDGGTVIVSDAGVRWRRIVKGPYDPKWFGAVGDGSVDDGPSIRRAVTAVPAGGAIAFSRGLYAVERDGNAVWCVQIRKAITLLCDPGTELRARTPGVRTVLRVSAPIHSTSQFVVNGAGYSNLAVEIDRAGTGTRLANWVGRSVSQRYSTADTASVFCVASAVNVMFDNCYAHDALSVSNSLEADTPGAARGFLFHGTASAFGINTVRNCRVDNIRNDRGLGGDYEDEDGIVTQMQGSRLLAEDNRITNCMKRGIKAQNPATVARNIILSSRTRGDRTSEPDGKRRMYAGISLYADDCIAEGNLIASAGVEDGMTGGGFGYAVEVGVTHEAHFRNRVSGNTFILDADTNAKATEFIKVNGAQVAFVASFNTGRVENALAVVNTYGIRVEGDHDRIRSDFSVTGNEFNNVTCAVYLRGGVSGLIRQNRVRQLSGPVGLLIEPGPNVLKPIKLSFEGNTIYGSGVVAAVRINDLQAADVTLKDNAVFQ